MGEIVRHTKPYMHFLIVKMISLSFKKDQKILCLSTNEENRKTLFQEYVYLINLVSSNDVFEFGENKITNKASGSTLLFEACEPQPLFKDEQYSSVMINEFSPVIRGVYNERQ